MKRVLVLHGFRPLLRIFLIRTSLLLLILPWIAGSGCSAGGSDADGPEAKPSVSSEGATIPVPAGAAATASFPASPLHQWQALFQDSPAELRWISGTPQWLQENVVTTVDWSPGGRKVLSGGKDGLVHVWDVDKRRELLRWTKHRGHVLAARFSPDGIWVASGGADGRLMVWNADSGELRWSVAAHGDRVPALAWGPNGKEIVTGGDDGSVRTWQASDGQRLSNVEGAGSGVTALAISPVGKAVAAGFQDGSAKLWPEGATEKNSSAGPMELSGHWDRVNAVLFTPDGKRVITGSGDGSVKLWDAWTGSELQTWNPQSGSVEAAVLSPDGQLLLTAHSDGTLESWSMARGERQALLKGHSGDANAVVFSPDGTKALSGGWDRTLRIWDVKTGQEASGTGHRGSIEAAALSTDGTFAATAAKDETLILWNVQDGAQIKKIAIAGVSGKVLAFSGDGAQVAVGGFKGRLAFLNVNRGDKKSAADTGSWTLAAIWRGEGWSAVDSDGAFWPRLLENESPSTEIAARGLQAAAFSSNGKWMAGIDAAGLLVRQQVAKTEIEDRIQTGWSDVKALAISADGARLFVGTDGGSLTVWSFRKKKELWRVQVDSGGVRALSLGGDSIAAAGYGGIVEILSAKTGERRARFDLRSVSDAATSISLDLQGKLLLLGTDGSMTALIELPQGVAGP